MSDVEYIDTFKPTVKAKIGSVVPRSMIPTKRTGYILSGIFLIVVVWALVSFPLGSFISGNINQKIIVGIPYSFLEFDLANPSTPPIKIAGLILDLLIYLLLAYIIDVVISLVLNNPLLDSEEKKANAPRVFRNVESQTETKETFADKLTKKMFNE